MSQTQKRGPRLSPEVGRSPHAVAGVQQIMKSIYAGGVPRQTLDMVHMRASQINGCNGCIAGGIKRAEETGLSAERLLVLSAWRDSALTEAMTRLADQPDAVTDEIWGEAAGHYDERALAALVWMIALTNFFNRVNTTLRTQ